MAKQVAKKEENHLLAEIESDAGTGMEGTDRETFAIPFMRVLQKSSPQCDETSSAYDPEARAGQFINTVSGERFDSVVLLPCAFERRFILWAPRGADQGFLGQRLPEEVARERADGVIKEQDGALYYPNEHGEVGPKKSTRLVDTRAHYALHLKEDGTTEQVLLTLTSTQIRKSKKLMTMLNNVRIKAADGRVLQPPTWMSRVIAETVPESNEQGSWYGVKFQLDGLIEDKQLYEEGRAFHKSIAAGEVEVRHDSEEANKEPEGF